MSEAPLPQEAMRARLRELIDGLEGEPLRIVYGLVAPVLEARAAGPRITLVELLGDDPQGSIRSLADRALERARRGEGVTGDEFVAELRARRG